MLLGCWLLVACGTGVALAACGSGQPAAEAPTSEGAEQEPAVGVEPAGEGEPPAEDSTANEAKNTAEAEPSAASGPPGELTFSYVRRKIVSCGMVEEEGEKRCAATDTVEEKGVAAEIVLSPIDKQDELDSSRTEQQLQFSDKAGPQTQTAMLEKGRWELSWKAESTVRDRFFVVASDRFDVALEATVGMCSNEGGKCHLEAAKIQQSIELPEARGVH
jgi:hypothetical protein